MLRSTHWIIDHSKIEMEHPGFKKVVLVGGTNHGFCESTSGFLDDSLQWLIVILDTILRYS